MCSRLCVCFSCTSLYFWVCRGIGLKVMHTTYQWPSWRLHTPPPKKNPKVSKVHGFHVAIFLVLTSWLLWYMARLVIKNGHQKVMCMMRLNYVYKMHTPFEVQTLDAIGRAYMNTLKNQNLHFELLCLLKFNFDCKSWIELNVSHKC